MSIEITNILVDLWFQHTTVAEKRIESITEAYADARVKEALEEVANAIADPVYIEAAIENFTWVSHGNYVRAHHILRDAVESIRALIPTDNTIKEQQK